MACECLFFASRLTPQHRAQSQQQHQVGKLPLAITTPRDASSTARYSGCRQWL